MMRLETYAIPSASFIQICRGVLEEMREQQCPENEQIPSRQISVRTLLEETSHDRATKSRAAETPADNQAKLSLCSESARLRFLKAGII